jgi:hypothetical protein
MEKKKTIKKIKSTTKDITKKTKSFLKKTSKKAGEVVNTLEKQWKKEQPQREKLKKVANKTLKNSIKISEDVFETIKKDIDEIKKQNKSKK